MELVGRRTLRHRKHDVVNKLRCLATRRNPSLRVMPPLVDLEVPVLQQLAPTAFLGQDRPVIGFKVGTLFKIGEMRGDPDPKDNPRA